ncbi:MAG: isoprenylcysteine carboxylmethyltransferase family protein [Anaerolineales bacterium]
MSESLSHLWFVTGFLLFIGIRMYYFRRASREGGKMDVRDSRMSILLRLILGIPLAAVMVGYMIRPNILAFGVIAAPEWVAPLGAGLTAVSFPLLIWVQHSLGANFNTILGIREHNSLVTHGPYRWVRHPMYTVLFLYMLGILLLTRNLIVGGFLLGAFLITIGSRLTKEEAILEEEYGEAYRTYKARTGRFLPRLAART